MDQAFAEYKDVSVTDPLRQGDVIEATDTHVSQWRRHLLVITADCDFANAKHQGRITCVPLLSQDEYLLEFQVPRIRDRVVAKAVTGLEALLARADGPAITLARLKKWPTEHPPQFIVEALGLSGPQADEARQFLSAIRTASASFATLDEAVTTLVRAQVEIPNGKTGIVAHRETIQTLRSHYLKPPGDALFLSAIAPSHRDGYFVYLRHLEQISEPEIALGPTRNSIAYRRLARLQDRFIHAVSQQFALVFMTIGLPREYEEVRDFHSELLGDRYK